MKTNNVNAVQSYGWDSELPPCSCGFILPHVLAILKTKKIGSVLDIGCGNGFLCAALHKEGYKVAGVEYDSNGYEIARKTYPMIHFYQGSIYDSPDALCSAYPERFDCVISTEVIEHLYSPAKLPLFAKKLLKPNGFLIISTPYHGYLKCLLISLLAKYDAHHDVLWEGGHIKFWSRKTLSTLLKNTGFNVIGFHGCGRFPYLWKSMVVVAQKQCDLT